MGQSLKRYALALAVLAVAATTLAAQAAPRSRGAATDADLFDDRVLHRLDIQVSERDWQTLQANYTANTYYPATLVWRGETVRNVGIRSRGSGTRSATKPGILVDFDRYVGGQRFLGLKALVLDNHLQDASAMREALTMAIHRTIGVPAPREAPAALYINGNFLGLYTMVENLDSVAMSRMFDPRPDGGPSPATVPGRAPTGRTGDASTRVARILPPAQAVPREAGPSAVPEPLPTGYLFEYNWLDYFWGTYPGPDLDVYADLLEAETRDDEPLENLYRPVEAMFREINQAADDRFAERVGAYLDLREFIRLAAVQAYMADWDGVAGSFGFNNFYLYRPADGGPHVLIPWDEDGAFYDLERRIDSDIEKHVLLRRAMAVPELRALYAETLEAIMALTEARGSGQTAGWLEREIARRRALVSRLVPQDTAGPHTPADFESAVSFNVDFARRRPAVVRAQLQELRASWPAF